MGRNATKYCVIINYFFHLAFIHFSPRGTSLNPLPIHSKKIRERDYTERVDQSDKSHPSLF